MTPAHVYALLIAAVPALLAFTVVTTAINQFSEAFVKPRFPRAAHIVNVLCVDYVKAVQALASFVSKPRGFASVGAWLVLLFVASVVTALVSLTGCTPAEFQEAKAVVVAEVPVLAQVDAIGRVIAQAVGWCEVHGATPDTVVEAKKAIADKDLPTAVDVVRKMLIASAKAGVPVPADVVALVETAEGAMAAEGIQDGMRALSAPSAAK